MNKFATKVMGVALTVPMVLGGAMVYADEAVVSAVAADDTQNASIEDVVPGDQVFQRDYYVSGTLPGGVKYYKDSDTFVAPVDGTYYFVTSDEDDNYLYAVRSVQPEFTIEGVTSYNPGDYWNCCSVVHLEAGEHKIDWQGYLPGWFTLTGTLLSADAPASVDPDSGDSASESITPSSPIEAVCIPLQFVPDEPVAVNNFSSIPVDQRLASVKNFIGHIYLEGLGRECEPAAMEQWVDMIVNQNVTGTQVATMILTSDEFEDKDLTDEEFVAILTSVFGDGISEQTALAALTSGKTRSSVINQFAGSEQWASKCAFYMVNV